MEDQTRATSTTPDEPMYTGLVEELGRLALREGPLLRIEATKVTEGASIGDSIAVNGCCLTVVALGEGWWEAALSQETLDRTNLATLRPGDPVNLERPVRLGDRLGGHIVQGHVDGVGTIASTPPQLGVELPQDLLRYCVEKGSITVDGVSLTIVEVLDSGISAAVIPHTAEVTTLGQKPVGAPVNIEVDILAKYVDRLLVRQGEAES